MALQPLHAGEGHQTYRFLPFDGTISKYRDWRCATVNNHAAAKEDQRWLSGVRVLRCLFGRAAKAFRSVDAEALRARGEEGFTWIMSQLDDSYGWQAEPFLFEALSGYFGFSIPRNFIMSEVISLYTSAGSRFRAVAQ